MPRLSQKILDAAEELGFDTPTLRSGGHYSTTHVATGAVVVFPATSSDHRSVKNTISQLEKTSGRRISKQRGFTRPRYVKGGPNYASQPRTEAEQRAERTVDDILFSVGEVDDRLEGLVDKWDAVDAHSPAALAIRAEVAKLCSRRETLGRAAARLFRSIPAVDVPGLEAITSTCSSEGDADISALQARFNG